MARNSMYGRFNQNPQCDSDNFRKINIMPNTADVIVNTSKQNQRQYRPLKPLIIEGKYASVEEYLDCHFRILREDFLRPLRYGLNDYIKLHEQAAHQRRVLPSIQTGVDNFRLFSSVSIEQIFPSQRSDDYEMSVNFDVSNYDDDLETSKILLHGSLVLLSHDSFETIFFGTVSERRLEDIRNGKVSVNIGTNIQTIRNAQQEVATAGQTLSKWKTHDGHYGPFLMIEPMALFAAYRPVLKVLQSFDKHTLPFSHFFVSCQFTKIQAPLYIRNYVYRWDFSALMVKSNARKLCNILDKSAWPTAKQLDLNSSQYEALHHAMTRKLAIIQGPPGTGKTFVGWKIVQLMLANFQQINSPILIVCYTNHALDSFLESILEFTAPNDIIRVGGQCKSEKLQDCLLTKVRTRNKTQHGRTIGDVQLLQSVKLIGMTTSGAAQYNDRLQSVSPAIVIIEEAAEVLEAHILASLNTGLQHLILIGDHHQLRPNPNDYELATDFHLEISLFERLIDNGCRSVCLEIQHRMRPEISRALMPHFYERLIDHDSVKQYANICGVASNMFFLTHNKAENTTGSESKSHKNNHEAWFVAALGKYLLQQGYLASQITMIAAYLGQVTEIKAINNQCTAEVAKQLKEIKVTTVDNYQGEENDIVILSLVRSVYENNTGGQSNRGTNIGFLAMKNRVCVALSRAKKGIFVIGNLGVFERKAALWADICGSLRQFNSLGDALVIQCQMHGRQSYIRCAYDFEVSSPQGGCKDQCNTNLFCGHICKRVCHSDDLQHVNAVCLERCMSKCSTAPANKRPHQCKSKCCDCRVRTATVDSSAAVRFSNICKRTPCPVRITRTLDRCGHSVLDVRCGKPQINIKCEVSVIKTRSSCIHQIELPCHQTPGPCNEVCGRLCTTAPNNVTPHKCALICYSCSNDNVNTENNCPPCNVLVDRHLDRCGHSISDVACGKPQINIKCEVSVIKRRSSCIHKVKLPCHQTQLGPCNEVCGRLCTTAPNNVTPHKCALICYSCSNDNVNTENNCPPCNVLVDRHLDRCGHSISDVACGKPQINIKCEVSVIKRRSSCIHKVKLPCHQSKLRRCNETCGRLCTTAPTNVTPHKCQFICYKCSRKNVNNEKSCLPCIVLIDRRLERCGHIVYNVPCGNEEAKLKCNQPCREKLPCCHECQKGCHPDNEPHTQMCTVNVAKSRSLCAHTVTVACYINPDDVECRKLCGRRCTTAPTDTDPHYCKLLCSTCYRGKAMNKSNCEVEPCWKIVDRFLPQCGHTAENVPCKTDPSIIECKTICKAELACGHQCAKQCHISTPLFHTTQCRVPVTKSLVECGHSITLHCYEDTNNVICRVPVRKPWPNCGHEYDVPCFTNVDTTPCPRGLRCQLLSCLPSCGRRNHGSCTLL